MEFDPLKINLYTIEELARFVDDEQVTFDELCLFGLLYTKRDKLQSYLHQKDEVRRDLHKWMRERPRRFTIEVLQLLMEPERFPETIERIKKEKDDDVISKFLSNGQKITYQELTKEGIVPPNISEEALLSHCLGWDNGGDWPLINRQGTNIFLIGAPRTGKTAILTGLVTEISKLEGVRLYRPDEYNAGVLKQMIESTDKGKCLDKGCSDSVECLNFEGPAIDDLSFFDINGETFRDAAEKGYGAWREYIASQCFETKKPKTLLFVVCPDPTSDDCAYERLEEAIPDTMFKILDREHGLHSVSKVAVIINTCNFPKGEPPQTDPAAYLQHKYPFLYQTIDRFCQELKVNPENAFMPHVFYFSLGKTLIGNNFIYNPAYSAKILDFLIK